MDKNIAALMRQDTFTVQVVFGALAPDLAADTRYNWVMALVAFDKFASTAKRNAELEQVVTEAYRHNLRRSFASQIMAGIDDANRDRVAALIGGK